MARRGDRDLRDPLLPHPRLMPHPDSAASEGSGRGDAPFAASAAEPLRVLGVDPELGFAGGEAQVLALTLELLRAGHRAELACDPRGRLMGCARDAGITCQPLSIRNAIDFAAAMRLRAILARGRYDVVHFHTSRAHAMAPMVRG